MYIQRRVQQPEAQEVLSVSLTGLKQGQIGLDAGTLLAIWEPLYLDMVRQPIPNGSPTNQLVGKCRAILFLRMAREVVPSPTYHVWRLLRIRDGYTGDSKKTSAPNVLLVPSVRDVIWEPERKSFWWLTSGGNDGIWGMNDMDIRMHGMVFLMVFGHLVFHHYILDIGEDVMEGL